VKALLYQMHLDFRKIIAFWKFPWLRPFVRLVRTKCRWSWVPKYFLHGTTAMASLDLCNVEVPRSHSRHTTFGRTPLDRWSARRRDLYLTTHNTHERQKTMPPAGFEPTIQACERPLTHALDRESTGIGNLSIKRGYLRPEHVCLWEC